MLGYSTAVTAGYLATWLLEVMGRHHFRSIAANSLIEANHGEKRRGRPSTPAAGDQQEVGHKRQKKAPCNDIKQDGYQHWPILADKRGRCNLCTKGQSNILCEKCDAQLCLHK